MINLLFALLILGITIIRELHSIKPQPYIHPSLRSKAAIVPINWQQYNRPFLGSR